MPGLTYLGEAPLGGVGLLEPTAISALLFNLPNYLTLEALDRPLTLAPTAFALSLAPPGAATLSLAPLDHRLELDG